MKVRGVIPVLAVALIAGMCGCSYPISKELRQEAREDLPFPTVQANPEAYKSAVVIWGGRIIKTNNLKDGTEIYVLQIPLDSRGSPEEDLDTQGRFIARSTEYLDPEVYKSGKLVTVAGVLTGQQVNPVGEVDYVYPVIDIKQLRMWQREAVYAYPGPRYGWGWGWGWGYWGPSYIVVPEERYEYYRGEGRRERRPR